MLDQAHQIAQLDAQAVLTAMAGDSTIKECTDLLNSIEDPRLTLAAMANLLICVLDLMVEGNDEADRMYYVGMCAELTQELTGESNAEI